MKLFLSGIIILILFSVPVKAQDSTNRAKLDTILLIQKWILAHQDQIYSEVVQNKEPLKNKVMGIEFNPAFFLVSAVNSYTIISGGLSLFAIDRHAELALPFYYQQGTEYGNNAVTLWNQDILYRRFLGQHQDGFYLECGFRYTHLRLSDYGQNTFLGINVLTTSSLSSDKAGALFGIGYRFFSNSGLYWGISLAYGTYFSEDHNDTIIDIELLKFGYAF